MSFLVGISGLGRAKARAGLPGSPTRNPKRSSRLDPRRGVMGWSLLSTAPTVAFATAIPTEATHTHLADNREFDGGWQRCQPLYSLGSRRP